jgi:hypothetical protein
LGATGTHHVGRQVSSAVRDDVAEVSASAFPLAMTVATNDSRQRRFDDCVNLTLESDVRELIRQASRATKVSGTGH